MALSKKYQVLMKCATMHSTKPNWLSAWDVYKQCTMDESDFTSKIESLEQEGLIEAKTLPGPIDDPEDIDVLVRLTETGWHRFCSIRDLLSSSKKRQVQPAD